MTRNRNNKKMHKKRTNEQHDENEECRGPNSEKVEVRRSGGPEGWGLKGGGPKGGAPQRGGSKGVGPIAGVPKFRAFFLCSGGIFVVFEAPGPSNGHV